jgi:hypothetical protein
LAKKGDWIIGTGSKKYGFQNRMVYAMEVTDTRTFKQYDELCSSDARLKHKIPSIESRDFRKRVGDCIYYYSGRNAIQREGQHDEGNIGTDLGGKKVLLSNNFYYFGNSPLPIPNELFPIVKQGQGHRSQSNNDYIQPFLEWMSSLRRYKNKVTSLPFGFVELQQNYCVTGCAQRHRINDKKDEALEYYTRDF